MTETARRPRPAGPRATQELAAIADSTPHPGQTRPRCLRCSHPLDNPRSVARAYGPRCWTRTELAQLDHRRDAVGRTLARVARRVPSLDAPQLALVADRLGDLEDALDAEAGAR